MNRCFICGDDHERVLQRHHIVPKNYGGSDDPENLVTVCANCHQAIEKMHDRRFYNQLKYHFQSRQGGESLEHEDDSGVQTIEVEKEQQTGLYRCPVCKRTSNRKGKPFEARQSVVQHIHGSHDRQHSNVAVRKRTD